MLKIMIRKIILIVPTKVSSKSFSIRMNEIVIECK